MLFVRDYLIDQTVLRSPSAPATPRVSVILPTFSRCRNGMLKRALDSVVCQTFGDFEFLVMDDGSTDGSADLIESFRARDPRIVHVRHAHNCGLPALRVNEGIELARGHYLAFQFDDDCWRPRALEMLVTEAERHASAAVIVGHARFSSGGQVWELPPGPVDLVSLYEQNRLANNSVLVPRQLVDEYGMYDCHIGMRRLCDWDLWLRYIRHVPFVLVAGTTSDVFESSPGAIGLTVPWDLALFRYLHDIPRDSLLAPATWREYEVDGLCIGHVETQGDFRQRLYRHHIVPYYLRNRHLFPVVNGFPADPPAHVRSALLTKNAYDVSNDVTLGHYDSLASRRGSYKAHFEPLSQVGANWPREDDMLLLIRTVEDQANVLAEQALTAGKPLGFYLDDDLLNFHEFGPKFGYLAPGTPYHANLSGLLRKADTVWVTNPPLAESARPLNPRIVPHNNCVPLRSLPMDIRPRDPHQPLRVGYVGTGYRLEEFAEIWEALLDITRRYGDRLIFEFWGLDVSSLPRLASPVVQRPFTFSYLHYLSQLRQAGFDITLSPLLDHPKPRLAKSLIKYYETTVAGALGIFSDVPQYNSLPAGLTCLKAKNTLEAWHAAIRAAVEMPPREADLMRRRALEHVKEEYTEVAQIHLHEAAWRATEFHAELVMRATQTGARE